MSVIYQGIEMLQTQEHIWVTKHDICQILDIADRTVRHHIQKLEELGQFEDGKHTQFFTMTKHEGKRLVTREVKHVSELAVVRIAFRVNSLQGLAFQEWAAETLLTLKRDGVVYDTSVKPTSDLSKMEWDYAATHNLLNALNIPPMKSLTARIGLLINSYQTKQPSPKKEEERQVIAHSHVSSIEAAEMFLSVIRDGLNTGEIYLEGEVFPEYDQRATDDDNIIESLPKGKLIGFYSAPQNHKRSVALFPNPAFSYVQSVLNRQGERIEYKKNDVWAQLHRAGYINKTEKDSKSRGNVRYDPRTFNKVTGRRVRAINLEPLAALGEARLGLKELVEELGLEEDSSTAPTAPTAPTLPQQVGAVYEDRKLNPYGW